VAPVVRLSRTKVPRTLGAIGALIVAIAPAAATTPTGSVQGTIVDAKGAPCVGASVMLLRCSSILDCQNLATDGFRRADDHGAFGWDGLPASGFYEVVAVCSSRSVASAVFSLRDGEVVDASLAIEKDTKATPVTVPEAAPSDLAQSSDVLDAMKEPAFCRDPLAPGLKASYRFLWRRTFHHPVLASVTVAGDGQVSAIYKETDGKGGYDPGKLIVNKRIDVSRRFEGIAPNAEMARDGLEQIFGSEADEEFWRLPYRVEADVIGVDGATWIVEGRKAGRCRLVVRWSPPESDPLRRFAWTLLGLTGQKFTYDEVY
jgi:hypothetical protein